MPTESRKPVDMREVIARVVDDSAWLDFADSAARPRYAAMRASTVT